MKKRKMSDETAWKLLSFLFGLLLMMVLMICVGVQMETRHEKVLNEKYGVSRPVLPAGRY